MRASRPGHDARCRRSPFPLKERVLSLWRRNLRWLTLILVPASFLTSLAEGQTTLDGLRDSIGRTGFSIAMVASSFFLACLLRPKNGVLTDSMARKPNGWLSRLRYGWYALAVSAPIILVALAAAGFFYTALELTRQVVATAAIIIAAVVVHHLVLRWLLLARIRLTIARAREKRRAQTEANESSSPDDEIPVELTSPEIDVATVNQLTQDLLRSATVLGVAVVLSLVWVEDVPVLNVLQRFQLWEVQLGLGEWVTLADLLLSLLTGVLTFFAARNLPGLLELLVLRHLPLDAGSRYAVSTIGRYVIAALGLMLAFNLIGIGWAKVQWLVAALGVGLGFGLQEIFANFVSGLVILLERPMRVGDTVTVGDISGIVSRIRIRATTIVDWDQKELIVPNKTFITGQLVNWTLSTPITRLIIKVGIAYGSDTELALRLMLAAAKEHPKVLADPEAAVFFVGFGESSLDFEVRVFASEVSNRGRTKVIHDLHLAIDGAFRRHGVIIAFPQRDLHFKSDERFTGEPVESSHSEIPGIE